MEDIKQRAKEMFDEKFLVRELTDGVVKVPFGIHEHYREPVKHFIDQIIDLAIAERDKEVVAEIEKEIKFAQENPMLDYTCHPVDLYNDGYNKALDQVISLIQK